MSKLIKSTLALIAGVAAQDPNLFGLEFGFCPKKPVPVGNFEPTRYQGTWYEVKRDKYLWYEKDTNCVTATYFFNTQNPLYPVSVNNQSYDYKKDIVTNTLLDNGDAYARAKFDEDGNGNVKFWWYPEGNYQVIDTDYNNYAIVYGCDDWFFSYTREVWLLSRTPRLDQRYVDYAMSVIEKKVGKDSGADSPYNLNRWIDTKQGGWCKYNLNVQDAQGTLPQFSGTQ